MVGSRGIGTISSLVAFDDETGKVFLIAVQYFIASIWHPFAVVLVSARFSSALQPAIDNVIESESMATARILTFMPYPEPIASDFPEPRCPIGAKISGSPERVSFAP